MRPKWMKGQNNFFSFSGNGEGISFPIQVRMRADRLDSRAILCLSATAAVVFRVIYLKCEIVLSNGDFPIQM